jgi:diaminopimelate decarboxylase
MTAFTYQRGILAAEDVPLPRIAEAVGTPAYVYSSAALDAAWRSYADALSGLPITICFALKANSSLAVIRSFALRGAGADVVSGGELKRALAAGVPASRIVFSGVGKTDEEMAAALEAGILQFNVESEPELEALSRVATARGQSAAIALRMNPDVDAQTHAKITTGRAHNKFGIAAARIPEVYARAARLPGIVPVGIAVHIGSQLTDLTPFRLAFRRAAEMTRELRRAGQVVRRLDLGGGLGISYQGEKPPRPADETKGLDCEFIIEPGRSLVAAAGVLLTRVIYVKDSEAPGSPNSGSTESGRRFVILDAAMNDLIRPMLYDAWHNVRTVREPPTGAPNAVVDLVGPICETGDTFALDRPMPPVTAGDLLVIEAVGAYGATMASSYNSRPLAPEILVRGSEFAVARPRQTIEDQLRQERLPDWLGAGPPQRGVA